MKKLLTILMGLILVLSLVACTERVVPEEEVVQAPETQAEAPAETEAEAPAETEGEAAPVEITESGSIIATAEGFSSDKDIKVEVVLDGDTIKEVKILDNGETPEVAGDALEKIPAAIVEANSADVDVVAGATWTSNGIMQAVKNAIAGAGSGESSDQGGAAPADGTLTGKAEGFSSEKDITVEVVVEGGVIKDVKVVDNGETPEVAGEALEKIPAAIVEANSADVDVVAGATWTSNGIMNAVKDAMK